MMWMLLFSFFYTLGDGIYILPGEQFRTNLVLDLLCAVSVPLCPLFGYLVLRTIIGQKQAQRLLSYAAFLMVIYTSMLLVSAILAGFDQLVDLQTYLTNQNHTFDLLEGIVGMDALPVQFQTPVFRLYLILTRPVFYLFVMVGALMVISFILVTFIGRHVPLGQFYRFLFKNEPISAFYLICVLFIWFGLTGVFRIVVGLDFLQEHLAISAVYTLVEAFVFQMISYASEITALQRFTRQTLFQQLSFKERGAISAVDNEPLRSPDGLLQTGGAPLPDDADKILAALRKLMEEDLLYLNPDLTIEDVASELGSNRVYVSRIVNQLLRLSFRDYINNLRIDYSMRYMLEHPNYTQEAIALACGYQDAAAFNRKFRQLNGVTPREWLLVQSDKEEAPK